MRAREFLNEVRREQRRLIHLNEVIRTRYCSLLPGAIQYDRDKVQTMPEDPVSRIMADVVDLQRQLKVTADQLQQKQTLAVALVDAIGDLDAQRVARRYYLTLKDDGFMWTLSDMAEKEGYTDRHVRRLLRQAQDDIDQFCYKNGTKLKHD